ncbi:MAG: YhfC family glutamic-type intramembrane protease [Anaerolineae bacterium]
MNPLDLVGVPDWRSALLALAFAAPWFLLLAGRWLRRPWLWVVAVAGAVLFSLSIAWVQVPIQQALNDLYLHSLSMDVIQRYVLLLGAPLVLVAGLVQEVAKFLGAVAGLHLDRRPHVARAGLAFGAAAGAGYGVAEAFWVLNQVFAAGFTWATVQLNGAAALVSFIERIFAVMFHIGIASLAAYGYAIHRPWRYLLLAILLHAVVDYTAVMVQAGALSIAGTETVVAIIASVVTGLALALRFGWRSHPTEEETLASDDGAPNAGGPAGGGPEPGER